MTTLEAQKKIGTKMTRIFGGLAIEVVVVDVKVSYGQERFLVRPAAEWAKNEVWINA